MLNYACLIECTILARSNTCRHSRHIYGHDDPNRLNERLYYKIEEKLKAYPKQIIGGHSLVVAVQNECCALYDSSVMEVAFGAWRFQAGTWTNLWDGTPDVDGLFGKYPHCSGILHSTWNFHLFIPNPDTAIPADPSLFQFADIAEPEFLSNGSINASAAARPPKEAHFPKMLWDIISKSAKWHPPTFPHFRTVNRRPLRHGICLIGATWLILASCHGLIKTNYRR